MAWLISARGTRLAPYTQILPKPLMPIGDMPILEVLIRQMKGVGIEEVILTVGHLEHLLRSYFEDGSRYGVRICYSQESKPLGTAGPLVLVPGLEDTFLVSNGDVLTTLDLTDLIAFHRAKGAVATIAMHHRQVNIDLGVLELDSENRITGYIEKPTYDYMVSMGIYVFRKAVLDFIPSGEYYGFDDLMTTLLANGELIQSFPFAGKWLDIGIPADYERAQEELERNRGHYLPGE